MSANIVPDAALDQLFRTARTANAWQDKPVDDALLRQIYEIMKFGPTAANGCPLRIVFVTSPAAKEKLKPCLSEGNRDKTMSAPVVAIFAMDSKFYEHLPLLFPHNPAARSWFEGHDDAINETLMRNSSLQAAYFMVAARALGLDCGPMSGFDAAALNRAFFPDGRFRANFICSLGYGDHSKTFARAPRLDFDTACQIV